MDLRNFKEKSIKNVLFSFALVGLFAVSSIFLFVAKEGVPLISKTGLISFISGLNWRPTPGNFGILPLLVGTFTVTALATFAGGLLAILTAIFFSEIASTRIRNLMRPVLELLAAIPSVIYGFIGILVFIPLVNQIDGPSNSGFGIFTASVILAIMILPTIATISEDALRSVPSSYRQASYGMAATRWQTIRKVVLPAAKSGIFTAVILGVGRAVGETMAVLMVIGNPAIMPKSIFSKGATMTSIIALDMAYAAGDHRASLFALAFVLFVIVMILIIFAYRLRADTK